MSGTDAMTNGQTASDVMKVVKEEVLLVRVSDINIISTDSSLILLML